VNRQQQIVIVEKKLTQAKKNVKLFKRVQTDTLAGENPNPLAAKLESEISAYESTIKELKGAETVLNGTVSDRVWGHSARVKSKELTPKQFFSVPCPTCGVAAGKRCELHSGGLRSAQHINRKLSAMEAIERTIVHSSHARLT
jgi:hypothetical protein